MKKLICLCMVVGLLSVQEGKAQLNADSIQFFKIHHQADSLYHLRLYSVATPVYIKAYELAVAKKMLNYYSATNCMIYLGHCYYNLELYSQAHKYYYAALKNARLYSHHQELKLAALKMLH